MTLRVNLYGNICNNLYVVAKYLRQAGVDARLFLEKDAVWRPEQEEPDLRGHYPDWIQEIGDVRWLRYGLGDGGFVRALGKCDVVHVSGYGPIWARKTGKPFVFQTYGGDLHTLPFQKGSLHRRWLAKRQAEAVRHADVIAVGNLHLFDEAAGRLGLDTLEVLPLPIDADRFSPGVDSAAEEVRAGIGSRWLLFHPTRQSWVRGAEADTWKANDRAFRAFARLVQAGRDATLLAIAHGPDVAASRRLAAELGVAERIRWVDKVDRHDLVAYYRAADVVLDQFALGGYGGIALEAWACGKPLVISLEGRPAFDRDPPAVLSATSVEEIFDALMLLTSEDGRRDELGRAGREWILRNHHGAAVAERYLSLYRRVLESHGRTV